MIATGAGAPRLPRLVPVLASLVLVVGTLLSLVGTAHADAPATGQAVSGTENFDAVACPPAPTATTTCFAVGYMTGASQPSATALTASGTVAGTPTVIDAVSGDQVTAIACPTSTLCVATLVRFPPADPTGGDPTGPDAGYAVPLTINGTTLVPGTPVAIAMELPEAIACPTATTCAIAGGNTALTTAQTTTVTVAGTALVAGTQTATVSGQTTLLNLRCTSVTSCLVSGTSSPPASAPGQPEVGGIAVVNPTVGGTVTPVKDMAFVDGVTCSSATSCLVSGQTQSGHGAVVPVTNGTAGAAQVLYNTDSIDGVSCVGTTCEGVGDTLSPDSVTESGIAVPVVNDVAGAVRPVDSGGALYGVVCATSTSCVGVGDGAAETQTGYVVGVGPVGSSTSTAPAIYCTSVNGTDNVVATAETADGGGYWMTDQYGDVTACGDAAYDFNYIPDTLTKPIVAIIPGPDDEGYWLVASDGGIFSQGDVGFYGSAGNLTLTKPVVGGASTADGKGYWLVASDGGIFSYGDAHFAGSAGNIKLTRPVVGMAPDPATGGYWLVASDGGIFAYNAPFEGSAGNIKLTKPVVGMAATDSGTGYWLDASDGGIFAYNAPFEGSAGNLTLGRPVIGMIHPKGVNGYQLVGGDGGIFSYGAPFYGSGYPIWVASGAGADARPAAKPAIGRAGSPVSRTRAGTVSR